MIYIYIYVYITVLYVYLSSVFHVAKTNPKHLTTFIIFVCAGRGGGSICSYISITHFWMCSRPDLGSFIYPPSWLTIFGRVPPLGSIRRSLPEPFTIRWSSERYYDQIGKHLEDDHRAYLKVDLCENPEGGPCGYNIIYYSII